MLEQLGINAKKSAENLAVVTSEKKNKVLEEIAKALVENTNKIIEANKIDLENGKNADSVQLVGKTDTNVIVPAGLDRSAVIYEYVDKPESISAPVTKGDDVCKVNIIYGNEVIATADLVAAQTVELSTFLKIINALKSFFSSPIVKIIAAIIVLLIIAYIALCFSNSKKKKNMRRRKQEERQRRDDDDYLPPPAPSSRR